MMNFIVALANNLFLTAAYLSPIFLVLVLASPFIVIKLRQKKFTAFNIIISIIIDITIAFLVLFRIISASRIEDALISLLTSMIALGFLPFLLLMFTSPFIIIKLRKKKFTILNVVISSFIGTCLAVATLYAAYWGLALMQGIAAYELYGGQI